METLSTAVAEPVASHAPEPTEAQREWARCRNWISEAIDHSPQFETIEDVENGVAAGRLVFWAGKDNAFITRVDEYPAGKLFTLVYAGGDIADKNRILKEFDNCARFLGCTHVAVECGHQQTVALKRLGFKTAFVTVTKPVSAAA